MGTSVDGSARAGLSDDNAAEFRQDRLQSLPNPTCNYFAGRVLEARDVVEIVVVELLVYGVEGGLEVAEIADPAEVCIEFAQEMNLDPKRMAVQAGALVARRHIRKPVRRFEAKLLKNFHLAKRPSPSCSSLGERNRHGKLVVDGFHE